MKSMKVFTFCFLAFAVVFAVACRPAAAPVAISNRPVSVNGVPQTNLPMPPIRNVENLGWETFEGKQLVMNDFKGKAVILDFWATYCPPCIEEIPHLVKLQTENSANLQVVGLHVGGEEDRPKVPPFVEKLKINYMLATPEDDLSDALIGGGDAPIPQTFVFDKNGRLVQKFVGFDEQIRKDLDAAVREALSRN
jgi:thiol-disulfide isomerase/thioredoxin